MTRTNYDTTAKRTASRKPIIAFLLCHLLEEFEGMTIDEILSGNFIEPPQIRRPIAPQDDIQYLNRIVGLNGEVNDDNTVTVFDILLVVRTPQDKKIQLNIEIQGQLEDYDLLNRIIYYLSRQISPQKGRGDFVHSNYDALENVCSVWICIKPSAEDRASVGKLHLSLDWLHPRGKHTAPEDARRLEQKLRAFIVNLPKPNLQSDGSDWLDVLGLLFGRDVPLPVKRTILQKQGIFTDTQLMEDLQQMTSLDDVYREEWREEGLAEGREKGRAEGRAEGRVAGKAEGREEALAEFELQRRKLLIQQVGNLIKSGDNPRRIANILCASLTEVREIVAAHPEWSAATA